MPKDTGEQALPILRAVLALGRRLRSERLPGAVSLAGLSILGTLSRRGPLVATRLAAEERLQPQSLTRIVASLEADGLIARRRSETDRRAIVIALTARGRAVLASDLLSRRRWLEKAMAEVLEGDERKALIAASGAMLKLAFHAGAGEHDKG